mmetsp:Transcript_24690/g.81867  ORF Transcript_24690/g.81867 Transcript_24690/m.81867 type:complete len:92 (-) Transcript_24690:864-1139(-)
MEIKTVVVGDTDAGKTSLSERFCYGDSPMSASPTIGASFLQKRVYVQDEHGGGTHNVLSITVSLNVVALLPTIQDAGRIAAMGYGGPGALS